MSNIESINAELKRRLNQGGLERVTAVEAARWLDAAGVLRDSPDRPGLPLRKLLREGRIAGQQQDDGKWFIYCNRAEGGSQPVPAVGTHHSPVASRPPQAHPSEANAEAWYETLRLEYKPATIKILLIAESPPDPGVGSRRFFYAPDLSQHDNLFRGVAEALYGAEPGFNVHAKVAVLRRIQGDGFWLVDALERPVNYLPGVEKSLLLRASVPLLVDRCAALAPLRGVILCKRVLYDLAAHSMRDAGLQVLHE